MGARRWRRPSARRRAQRRAWPPGPAVSPGGRWIALPVPAAAAPAAAAQAPAGRLLPAVASARTRPDGLLRVALERKDAPDPTQPSGQQQQQQQQQQQPRPQQPQQKQQQKQPPAPQLQYRQQPQGSAPPVSTLILRWQVAAVPVAEDWSPRTLTHAAEAWLQRRTAGFADRLGGPAGDAFLSCTWRFDPLAHRAAARCRQRPRRGPRIVDTVDRRCEGRGMSAPASSSDALLRAGVDLLRPGMARRPAMASLSRAASRALAALVSLVLLALPALLREAPGGHRRTARRRYHHPHWRRWRWSAGLRSPRCRCCSASGSVPLAAIVLPCAGAGALAHLTGYAQFALVPATLALPIAVLVYIFWVAPGVRLLISAAVLGMLGALAASIGPVLAGWGAAVLAERSPSALAAQAAYAAVAARRGVDFRRAGSLHAWTRRAWRQRCATACSAPSPAPVRCWPRCGWPPSSETSVAAAARGTPLAGLAPGAGMLAGVALLLPMLPPLWAAPRWLALARLGGRIDREAAAEMLLLPAFGVAVAALLSAGGWRVHAAGADALAWLAAAAAYAAARWFSSASALRPGAAALGPAAGHSRPHGDRCRVDRHRPVAGRACDAARHARAPIRAGRRPCALPARRRHASSCCCRGRRRNSTTGKPPSQRLACALPMRELYAPRGAVARDPVDPRRTRCKRAAARDAR